MLALAGQSFVEQEKMTTELITKKQMEIAGRLGLSGAYEEALDVLDRLIKLYPNYVGAIVYKGNLLDLWGLSGSVEEEEPESVKPDTEKLR